MFEVMFHPQAMLCYVFGAVFFGFTVGINVTLPIFLAEPKRAGGFGYSHDAISTLYLVPIVSRKPSCSRNLFRLQRLSLR